MRRFTYFWVLALWPGLSVAPVRAGQPEEDEVTLKEAKLQTDAPALVEFFRKRVLPENDHQRVHTLIRKLGADAFAVREKASTELIAMGPAIAPLLREATASSDPEVLARAREALAAVEKTSTAPLLSAAVRLLAQRKSPEASKVLLDFAPSAGHLEVLEVMREVLPQLAVHDGKPDPALKTALTDKEGLRRALAIEALIRAKELPGKAAHKFLADGNPLVQLRAAQALADRGDREAVPVLIDVLPSVTLPLAWEAENILTRLAGDQAPQVSLGEGADARKAARDAWQRWWKEHGAKVDLAKLKKEPPFLGLTLVAIQDVQGRGQLMELGRDGKMRWQFGDLAYPVDVQVVGNDRFLVAEMNGARVTERNRKGEILWQKQVQQPVACQRLGNGNTLIATPTQVLEFDAAGKQVFTYNRGRWDILGARKHRNGEYVLLTRTHVVRIDNKAQEVKSFPIGRTYNWSSFDLLANGNLLLPLNRVNRVVEYTLEGKEVWSAEVPFPTSARRLPNGNTVAASMNFQRVTEVDRAGKQVSQTQVEGTPWCALRH
ncbi:MAG: HEAT repeat domain-containing protein [Planctomycetes bacterium]|nr:HEAT repeat domain-containing protein [Planctomycetota bacterium]